MKVYLFRCDKRIVGLFTVQAPPNDPFFDLTSAPSVAEKSSHSAPVASPANPSLSDDSWFSTLAAPTTSSSPTKPAAQSSPLLLPHSPRLSRPVSTNSLNNLAGSRPVPQAAADPFGDLSSSDTSKPVLSPTPLEPSRGMAGMMTGRKRDPFADLGNVSVR